MPLTIAYLIKAPFAPDAFELFMVLLTLLVSMAILVALGAWWSR